MTDSSLRQTTAQLTLAWRQPQNVRMFFDDARQLQPNEFENKFALIVVVLGYLF